MSIKRCIMIATMTSLSSVCAATSSSNVSVSYVIADGARVYVDVTPRAALPACATQAAPNRYGFDTSSANGQINASIALTAFLTGKKVSIAGLDTCTGGIENLGAISIN